MADLHKALEVVNSEGMTRLEAAEQERRTLVLQALNQHRGRAEANDKRLAAELDHITKVFAQRVHIA